MAVRMTVRGLVAHVSAMTQVPVEKIMGRDRFRFLIRLRRAVTLIALESPGRKLTEVAMYLGYRDHTTIINLRNGGMAALARDPEFAAFVDDLRKAASREPQGPMAPGQKLEIDASIAREAARLAAQQAAKKRAADGIRLKPASGVEVTDKAAQRDAIRSSEKLLMALHRAHPDRVPKMPRTVWDQRPARRAGCTMADA